MGSIKSIIIMLISFTIFTTELNVYATNSFTGIETKINSTSNTTKIKKMQSALKEFKLYDGEIDGNYSSVEPALIAYQKENWIITEQDDYWAGHFGEKTLIALREDFPEQFNEVIDKNLKMEEPVTIGRYFYVTAYYSPLPGQRRYTTWSFEWDIRLNWNWKHTASWKPVFSWLLAAPTNYTFWTKIELEWLWVWEVSDRWGAIVNSWERWHDYDRIDVWMWYGDEWLSRAMKWWKRKVLWKIVPGTREITMEFATSPVAKYSNLIVDAEKPLKKDVIELQNLLTEVKIYTWAVDWNYDNVKEVLIKYQVENNIISSKNDPEAWYFWAKTLAVLREEFGWELLKLKNNKLDEDVVLSAELKSKLDLLNNKITLMIDKKYWKNTPKAIEYRNNLRSLIEKQTKKIRNEQRIKQMKYLKSII